MLSAIDMAEYTFPDLLSENTGSPSAIGFLARKYKECLETHIECGLQQSSPDFYPSRLLDVGALDDIYVSLRHMRDLVNVGPYFCLSHCTYYSSLGHQYVDTLTDLHT